MKNALNGSITKFTLPKSGLKSKVLEIVEDNTLTDYIKREQMIVGINKIIASPPSGLSSEDLKFLKVWATEWINLVSAETTKLILARLLSRPVKID